MEKVIRELRIIETDDGYRVEIKGDKEGMKRFLRGVRGRHARGHRHGRGPFRMFGMPGGAFGFGGGPGFWAGWAPWDVDFETEIDDEEQDGDEQEPEEA